MVSPDVASPEVVPVEVEPLVAVGSLVLVESEVVTVEVEPLDVVGAVELDGAVVVAEGDSTTVVGVGSGALLTGEDTVGVAVTDGDGLGEVLGAAVVEAAVDVMNVPGWSASTMALISSVYACS